MTTLLVIACGTVVLVSFGVAMSKSWREGRLAMSVEDDKGRRVYGRNPSIIDEPIEDEA